MKIYYSPKYVYENSLIETTKKSKWISEQAIKEGFVLTEPQPLKRVEAELIHSKDYVDKLYDMTLKFSAIGTDWDADLLASVQYSNGGVRDAVLDAINNRVAGTLSSGLHHAGVNHGKGFCQVNGLALGAVLAQQHGFKVGVLDVDAHCGGGTYEILKDTGIAIYDLSTNEFDDYEPEQEHQVLEIANGDADYLIKLMMGLRFLKERQKVNFILLNAGMDSTLDGISPDVLKIREKIISKYCLDNNIKVVWVLAGGYLSKTITEKDLVDLHMATLRAFQWRKNAI